MPKTNQKPKLGSLPLGSGMLKKSADKIKKRKKNMKSRLDQIMNQIQTTRKKK